MIRTVTMTLAVLALSILCTGCMSRMIGEGMGVARGASGKVVTNAMAPDLTVYKAMRVEPISVAPDLDVPAEMPRLIQTDLTAVAAARGLAPEGQPALKLSGEIVHYEPSSTVDTAIGPLAEVIVRARLINAQSGNVVARANLVGRSKATTSSSPKDLSAGVGKALDKWLKEGGLKKAKENENE
jgi:hypothetical protein